MNSSSTGYPSHRQAIGVLILALLICVVAGYITATSLRLDTDTAELLSPDLPFRKTYEQYREQFPWNDPQLILVVEAVTPEQAEQTTAVLLEKLKAQPERFDHVHQPDGGDFFKRNGLLFKSVEELQTLSQRVSRIAPLMTLLSNDPSLRGLLVPVQRIVAGQTESPSQANAMLTRMAQILEAQMTGMPDSLSWQRLMNGNTADESIARCIVICQPNQDFGKLLAARDAMATIDEIKNEMGMGPDTWPRLRVTGQAALAFEEIRTLKEGTLAGGPAALIMVAIILYIGFRSMRMVGATIVTLLVGLVITGGFAALTVGRLNLISVAFAMLYVGLGVDFAIHFGLRYRALRRSGESRHRALVDTRHEMAKSLTLCALTTALGFFAFVPTAFIGVAELGVIAGGGMVISLIVTLTVFPAILTLAPQNEVIPPKPPKLPAAMKWIMERPAAHRQAVLATTLALTVLSCMTLPSLRFNSDPLDLRESASEAVQTMRDLRAKGSGGGQLGALILADSAEDAKQLQDILKGQPQIKGTFSLLDLVPQNQQEKTQIIRQMGQLAGTNWSINPPKMSEISPTDQIEAIRRFLQTLTLGNDRADEKTRQIYAKLAEVMSRWLVQVDGASAQQQAELVLDFQDRMLSNLPEALRLFGMALSAEPYSIDTMPQSFRTLWIGEDGTYRIVVQPTQPLVDDTTRRDFVTAVRAVAPQASGATVIQVEAGESIVESFAQAMIYAGIGIVALLLIILRDLKHSLMVLLPLFCGGVMTAAAMVLMDIPFNFANVIALPLLLGAGVDNGIHMIQRSRRGLAGRVGLLETSTARGVLFSSLTTLCGFGGLALSPHPGTASMGLVLMIGLVLVVGCTLILLPALLHPEEEEAQTADSD